MNCLAPSWKRARASLAYVAILLVATTLAAAQSAANNAGKPANTASPLILPLGVEKLCTITFDKDEKRPARLEDSALPCLTEIANTLKQRPDKKIVLVGVSDSIKDHEEKDAAEDREEEDMTGLQIRFEDISAYRAVNTKDYLVRYFHILPSRLIPTTNENRHGQDVAFYLVPGDANFIHNYLNTTRTNEKVCTVRPCYDKREEADTPQPREQIRPTTSTSTR